MSFASMSFILFIMVILFAYFGVAKRFRWIVLLVASYLFYMFNSLRTITLMVLTTISVFWLGCLLDREHRRERDLFSGVGAAFSREEKKNRKKIFLHRRRLILCLGLFVNLGVLAIVKYLGFAFDSLNSFFSLLGISPFFPDIHFLLPLGISFYTFQSLGYLIDVYRGKISADKNFFQFSLFVSFFPQIVQGPIGRYSDLAKQLYEPHDFDYERVKYGVQLAAWGMFKKLVLADRAAKLVDVVIPNVAAYEGIEIVFTMLIYILQVYTDFSGGIDIARGVAQCFGITMAENFARPHFAISVSDYWRRWHITLGAWMRDYLFYPLSLSKPFARMGKFTRKHFKRFGKIIPTCLAMFIVFLTVGIWHGAETKYVLFGIYYGVLIVGGILLEEPAVRFHQKFPKLSLNYPLWRIFVSLRTFFAVFVGKYFAAASSAKQAFYMLGESFGSFQLTSLMHFIKVDTRYNYRDVMILLLGVVLLFIVGVIQEKGIFVRDAIAKRNIMIRWMLYLIMAFILLLDGLNDANLGFMYAEF